MTDPAPKTLDKQYIDVLTGWSKVNIQDIRILLDNLYSKLDDIEKELKRD